MPLHFRRHSPRSAVSVDAPARLHLGFLDPSGTLGRAFGSLGLVIDGEGTHIEARMAAADSIEGAASAGERARIAWCLDRLREAYGAKPIVCNVVRTPRAHTGLGSGTQLALAVGTAYARLTGHTATTAEIAHLLGRGRRSGIGILGFDSGGLLLDGGSSRGVQAAGVPPLVSRQPFPDEWRVLLVTDTSREGLSGDAERRGLATLAPFPQHLAAHLCHLALMRIMPAAAEADFTAFAAGVTELQQTIGEYFAPVQGGVFASPDVETSLRAAATERMAGIGQTSWGPTGFAFLASAQEADDALTAARAAARGKPHIECAVVRARNRGAVVRVAGAREERVDAA
ncbi:beta-ribofuranosylaminobenzene 5'-phosphate synthase family protein [Trinickia caryophylli]|uniref:Beta-RFAP synthase n=1 Tax=Trinickia caryophylli TaxID=28094 RepID=A0A1X7E3A2_TRICW|nr:beta-ribofuranosylaminobenzene 5'-phosphate synthase family protein [Trinickia caryophylli]PMS14015.1 beta-ribofuranosylaminobenzene 5'-phosphate synthase [Trinickia caryophylli]TRX17708.1 beta-ribofuranosylaminobenzene 5'-phosphate synthase [Trinickia caryophylli]WQE11532.1 beta-ribofuranosylaminobenzene 5'-phosphate synthase family protein [Trinickia caryophylli]SMF26263.1 beta-RFAP synthase [Trinickia caryophylli]GLU32698.1 beta-ribofuranosylaminobenzene 5'-phosphate synthase [Trinickia 